MNLILNVKQYYFGKYEQIFMDSNYYNTRKTQGLIYLIINMY
jgi:hypothetical protein